MSKEDIDTETARVTYLSCSSWREEFPWPLAPTNKRYSLLNSARFDPLDASDEITTVRLSVAC